MEGCQWWPVALPPGLLTTPWWPLLPWLVAGMAASLPWDRGQCFIDSLEKDGVHWEWWWGLHRVGIICHATCIRQSRGLWGKICVYLGGSWIFLGIGQWGGQLGPQGLALLLMQWGQDCICVETFELSLTSSSLSVFPYQLHWAGILSLGL